MAGAADSGPEYATTASGWDSLGYASFERFLRAVGGGAAGNVLIERPGIVATVVPASPERSLFNSVLYEHPRALADHYDEISEAYASAGVRAWCVWAPEMDRESARMLAGRGHALDGLPRMMTLDLEAVPDGEVELEIDEGCSVDTVCAINDAAYGYEEGTFLNGIGPAGAADMRLYAARWRDFDAAVLATLDLDGDCGVYLVATLPEARGNGLCHGLMERALVDARQRGCRTSTLQASPAGAPIYRRLGYRDLGGIEFRERREPSEPAPRSRRCRRTDMLSGMPAPTYSERSSTQRSSAHRCRALRGGRAARSPAAPGLQKVLAEALAAGGWFEDSHQQASAEGGDRPTPRSGSARSAP